MCLRLFPVGDFTLSQFVPQLVLHPLQLLLVSCPKGPLLVVQKSFQVAGNPQVIVMETANSLFENVKLFMGLNLRINEF